MNSVRSVKNLNTHITNVSIRLDVRYVQTVIAHMYTLVKFAKKNKKYVDTQCLNVQTVKKHIK